MALTANREVDHYVDQELRAYPVAAWQRIYKGALVEVGANGYLRALTGGGRFAGLAYEEGDNRGGADGDVTVRVYTLGDFGLPLAGAGVADIGRAIYATADDALTFDPSQATFVGHVQGISSPGHVVLRLGAEGPVRACQIEHRVGSFAIAAHQSGTTFTNLGATSAILATLPQNPPQGTEFKFVCLADQALRVAPGPAGGIYIKGAKQADNKYAAVSDIGDFIHLVADGNGDWAATASVGGTEADITIES
jgi:hypothetical protein